MEVCCSWRGNRYGTYVIHTWECITLKLIIVYHVQFAGGIRGKSPISLKSEGSHGIPSESAAGIPTYINRLFKTLQFMFIYVIVILMPKM